MEDLSKGMTVVLDANVLRADFHLRSHPFTLLRRGIGQLGLVARIPEVALEETINGFSEKLTEALSDHSKTAEALVRLAPDLVAKPMPSAIHNVAQSYRVWLVEELQSLAVQVLPYPQVSHREAVERDLARRKPFKQNGSGYRDFLIWESIKDLHRSNAAIQIAFVTGNTRDFAGDDGNLAEELAADLGRSDAVVLFHSLREFVDAQISPFIESLELRERIAGDSSIRNHILNWLHDYLGDAVINEDSETLGHAVTGLDRGLHVRAWDLISLDRLSINNVVPSGNGSAIVRISIIATVTLTVDIDWEDYVQDQQVRGYVGQTDEFTWMSEERHEELALSLDITLHDDEVQEGELWSISGSHGSVEWLSSSSRLWDVMGLKQPS